jgi:hypothetical protein
MTMKELKADIFGFAEINRTLWHGMKQKWEGVTRKFFTHRILHRKTGIKQPDPIKNFYEDLEKFLLHWKKQDYEIILMMDANETIGDKPGGWAPIMGRIIGLINLIHYQLQIDDSANTYIWGTKCIDYIFGTSKVQKYCLKSGMLPFSIGYPSDHRALFIKVDLGKNKRPLNRLIRWQHVSWRKRHPRNAQYFLKWWTNISTTKTCTND